MIEPIIFVLAALGVCLGAAALYGAMLRRGAPREPVFIAFKTAPKTGPGEIGALEILCSLAGADGRGNPLRNALVKVAKKNNLPAHPVEFFKEEERGFSGLVNRLPVIAGEFDFLTQAGLSCPPALIQEAALQEHEGKEVLYAGWEAEIRALAVFEKSADQRFPWREKMKMLAAAAGAAAALALASLCFAGCREARLPSQVLRGHVKAAEPAVEHLASQPNAVCYLIAEDKWGVPVLIKRWLNPKLPIVFKLTQQDLLMPSRPWQGPFRFQAYLFISQNPRQELPPPANAAKTEASELVYPGNSTPLELILRR